MINTLRKHLRKLAFTLLIPAALSACELTGNSSSTDSSSSSEDSVATANFPSSLAVASPLDYTASSSGSSTLTKYSTTTLSRYLSATQIISQILSATSVSLCQFDPEDFLVEEDNANCFGPIVAYDNHPDAGAGMPGSGELPPGDLGLWLETEQATGNACAAEQLNARMSGVESRSRASLSGLASMVCAASIAGTTLPDSSNPGTVDLVAAMTALGIADTTFNQATFSYDSTTASYAYLLDITYTPSGDTHNFVVTMEHTPSTSVSEFSGIIVFLVNDETDGGNCSSTDVTHNGSIAYDASSATEIAVEMKYGAFCGSAVDGRGSDGTIDQTDKLSPSNPNGWSDNFSILTANFDPSTLDGDYAFSWQAGPDDDNTRAFNVVIDNSGVEALAYYGYGEDIGTTDGSIGGFICNWAGPGADRAVLEYAQFQEISVDTTTGILTPTQSNLSYAPANGCEYDGSSSFVYDTDSDDDLSDEDATLEITLAAGTMDLLAGDDIDSDGAATIEEVITNSGFMLPSM